jgi:hypothetical protein
MTQPVSKGVSSFVGGLITEASELDFPENASSDELNCELERTGVRSRRRGIELETGAGLSSFNVATTDLVFTITWENVSGQDGLEFEAVQVGDQLYFYDKSGASPSTQQKSFSVDLGSFTAGNGLIVKDYPISAASHRGKLVIVSPAIDAFYLEYDSGADNISATLIDFRVRDFEWQGPTSEYFDNDGSPSDEREYDTFNTGWTDATVTTYGSFPALTHPWYTGKDATNDFDAAEWNKIYGGNTLQVNGHYILDLFSKNRAQAVSSDPQVGRTISIATETESARFSSVVSFAGRLWYSGLLSAKNGAKVFYTRVIESDVDYGRLYQDADPTSEDVSDLLDTDGGEVNIAGASQVRALFEWGSSILCFAENGVWEVSGRDGIFKATEFTVSRIRGAEGITNIRTLIDAEGYPIWWAPSGIYAMERDKVTLEGQGNNISVTTIQTFWEDIGAEFREYAKAAYDHGNKRCIWAYGNDSSNYNKYNKFLVFDIALGAWFPWTISDQASNTSYVTDLAYFSGRGVDEITENVTENTVNVTENGVQVTVTSTQSLINDQLEVRFWVRDGATGKLSLATMTNTDFLDWESVNYSSYVETGWDFMGDFTVRKVPIYITTYFKITETGFSGNETSGYDVVNPSGCVLKAYWDMKTSPSTSREIYRFNRPIVVDTGDLNSFNYPYESVITRSKIRGRGRNLKLRFESVQGKDFKLQGYGNFNGLLQQA